MKLHETPWTVNGQPLLGTYGAGRLEGVLTGSRTDKLEIINVPGTIKRCRSAAAIGQHRCAPNVIAVTISPATTGITSTDGEIVGPGDVQR